MPNNTIKDWNTGYDILLDEYNNMGEEDAKHFDIVDTVLKDSQRVQLELYMRWVQFARGIEIHVVKLDSEVKVAYAKALTNFKKNSKIDFSSTELKHLAEGDKDYNDILYVFNRYKSLKNKAKDMVDIINERKWQMKALVDIMINDGDGWII